MRLVEPPHLSLRSGAELFVTMGLYADAMVNAKQTRSPQNKFEASLAQLELELERARAKRREAMEAQQALLSPRTNSLSRIPDYVVRRHPVQRAPSRLYRVDVSDQTSNRAKYCCPTTCIGPEFVVRAANPVKCIRMTDIKHSSQRRKIMVILLNGQKLEVSCPSTMTAGQLFEVIVNSEGIEDNFTLGLAVLLGGDFVFPPSEYRLSKVAPVGWDAAQKQSSDSLAAYPPLTLYMRMKYFLPSLRGVRSWDIKHALYLQLRRSLLEQQIRCTYLAQLIGLMGLALQAEFGNFTEKEHGCGDYFLLDHYLPDNVVSGSVEEVLRAELRAAHRERAGLDPGRAEEMFISQVQQLPEYGAHFYAAACANKTGEDALVWVAVTSNGISIHLRRLGEIRRPLVQLYAWRDIRKLSYSRQQFCLLPSGSKKLKFRMDHRKSFFTFRLASLHHQFFLKLRTELSSLQSVAAEFGVPLLKGDKESISTTLSFTEGMESDGESVVDGPVTKAAILGPVCSRRIIQLPAPPGPKCRLRHLSNLLGATAFVSSPNRSNIEEIQNKENERPVWTESACRTDDRRDNPSEPKLRCESCDCIAKLNDSRQSSATVNVTHESVSPASTISRTSVRTHLGVPGENRTPSFPRRRGVRMGIRAFSLGGSAQALTHTNRELFAEPEPNSLGSTAGTPCGTRTPSEYSAPSSPLTEAYVINSSIRSVDEPFHMDSHESITESLAEKIGNISFEEERILRTVKLQRDRLGSMGIEIMEGLDGGVYVQSIVKGGAAAKLGTVHPGDRIVAVDGRCLMNLPYDEVLRILRSTGEEVALLLSQTDGEKEVNFSPLVVQDGVARLDACNLKNTPVEETYLRDIRYQTEECPAVPQMMSTPLPLPTIPSPNPPNTANPTGSVSLSLQNSEVRWRVRKKYPAPKPPLRGVCCIAPVPEDADDCAKDHTV